VGGIAGALGELVLPECQVAQLAFERVGEIDRGALVHVVPLVGLDVADGSLADGGLLGELGLRPSFLLAELEELLWFHDPAHGDSDLTGNGTGNRQYLLKRPAEVEAFRTAEEFQSSPVTNDVAMSMNGSSRRCEQPTKRWFEPTNRRINRRIDGSTRRIDGSTRRIDGSTRRIDGSTRRIDGSIALGDGSIDKRDHSNDRREP